MTAAGASDIGGTFAIRSDVADRASKIQKMKVTCVKLNASNVSIPTPKLVTASSKRGKQPVVARVL